MSCAAEFACHVDGSKIICEKAPTKKSRGCFATLKKSFPVSPNPNANIMKAKAKGKKTSITIPIIIITLNYLFNVKSSSFSTKLLLN